MQIQMKCMSDVLFSNRLSNRPWWSCSICASCNIIDLELYQTQKLFWAFGQQSSSVIRLLDISFTSIPRGKIDITSTQEHSWFHLFAWKVCHMLPWHFHAMLCLFELIFSHPLFSLYINRSHWDGWKVIHMLLTFQTSKWVFWVPKIC